MGVKSLISEFRSQVQEGDTSIGVVRATTLPESS
jgi:hypothetical protein